MALQKTLNIKQILNNPNFAGLMKKGLQLNELNFQLQQQFPQEFKGLYQVVNVNANAVNIDVKNATVRQALLFRQAELLQIAQRYYPEAQRLQFNVNPYLYST